MSKGTRGFTLLEVMVAMGILTVVMLGTMPMISYAIKRGADGRQITVAQQIGSELLEHLRNEVRYDAGGTSAGSATLKDAWGYDVLPHKIQAAAAAAAACVDGICCQPTGMDDGIKYHYGPYAFAREGNTFYACYGLLEAKAKDSKNNDRTGVRAGSAEANVRILWRGATGGWSSWAVGDLLQPGA